MTAIFQTILFMAAVLALVAVAAKALPDRSFTPLAPPKTEMV